MLATSHFGMDALGEGCHSNPVMVDRDSIIALTLQVRKLRLRETKKLAQDCTASNVADSGLLTLHPPLQWVS